MRVLLLRPERPLVSAVTFGEQTYPIGIGFLISVLRQAGHTVSFVDRYLQPDAPIDPSGFDVIGLSLDSVTYRCGKRLLEWLQVKREAGDWSGKLVVGGPHPSLRPEPIPDYVDHIVRGEGERALVDIVEGRTDQRIVAYDRIRNLDSLPFPAYDVFAKMPYEVRFAMMNPEGKLVNMNTSRGCPYGCRFCSLESIWGKGYTRFSAQRVAEDIERLVKEYDFSAVYFREDNYLLDRGRAIAIGDNLAEKRIAVPLGCEARVSDLLDESFVRELAQRHLRHVFLGIESLSDRVLELMRKKITVEQIYRALENCRRNNIRVFGSFIIGVPGETEEERDLTIDGAKKLFPDGLYTLNTFYGIPHSEMYEEAIETGAVDYMDDESGFFYLKEHDELMDITCGGSVPVWRKSPARFLGSPTNVNNLPHISCSGPGFVNPKDEDKNMIRYAGLLDAVRYLRGLGGCSRLIMNNILHLIVPTDLSCLLENIRSCLRPGGFVMGLARFRNEGDLREAIMLNYPAEYVYSKSEFAAALSSAGFCSVSFVPVRGQYVFFQAKKC